MCVYDFRSLCDCGAQGEDTFGDSDESEEDDVVVTNGGAGERGMGRPRLGLGASLASMVNGNGADGPTCTLQDHPIQVRTEKHHLF